MDQISRLIPSSDGGDDLIEIGDRVAGGATYYWSFQSRMLQGRVPSVPVQGVPVPPGLVPLAPTLLEPLLSRPMVPRRGSVALNKRLMHQVQ